MVDHKNLAVSMFVNFRNDDDSDRIDQFIEDRFKYESFIAVVSENIIDNYIDYNPNFNWINLLDSYSWANSDSNWAETSRTFVLFNNEIRNSPNNLEQVASKIFAWGRVRPRTFTEADIRSVVNAAVLGKIPNELTPWSSSWTKVAAAATHHIDLDPTAVGVPQVIWDSRVSYAVARLAQQALKNQSEVLDQLKNLLLIVRGRGGSRKIGLPLTDELKQQGWKFADGSWKTRSKAFWRAQIVGSQVVNAMARKLNSLEKYEDQRIAGRRWTSFDVASALFMYGK